VIRLAPCDHRGTVLRTESCPGCRGAVLIKVFVCTVHGACTLTKPVAGVAECSGCSEFLAVQAAQPSDCRSTAFDSRVTSELKEQTDGHGQ
jgi:hypothetical protein